MSTARLIEGFRAAIAACGITPPAHILFDGRLRRFATNGKANDKAGWYVAYPSPIPAGAFGDWRTGHQYKWSDSPHERLTPAERHDIAEKMRAAQEACIRALAASRSSAIQLAESRWSLGEPAGLHPYLIGKRVRSYGLRQQGKILLIPLRDVDQELCSLQTISPVGEKRFLAGGRTRGCFYKLGQQHSLLVICEGYATGASIHEATNLPVVVAFNAGNLAEVACAIRNRSPDLQLVLAADDDWSTAGNPGMTAARRAALAVGGQVVKPFFSHGRTGSTTDFNDLHNAAGLDEVRSQFRSAGVCK